MARLSLLALAGAALAPVALAQTPPPGAPPIAGAPVSRVSAITLYDAPNFGGGSVTLSTFAPDLGRFAGVARSVRVTGQWTACTGQGFAGTCVTFSGDVADLAALGLDRKVRSVWLGGGGLATAVGAPAPRQAAGAPAPVAQPPAAPRPPQRATPAPVAIAGDALPDGLKPVGGIEAQDGVFFARPALGIEVAAPDNPRAIADLFCKRAGYSEAISASRASGERDSLMSLRNGKQIRAYPLRDVLCRK